MNNTFGFHGERSAERGMGLGLTASRVQRRRKTISTSGMTAVPQQPNQNVMIPNPLLKNTPSNTMTYNGMYNVAAVTPPPLNQRPPRKSTRPQSQFPLAPNAPLQYQQPVAPVMPVNSASSARGIPVVNPVAVDNAMSDLQAKVAQWRQNRTKQQLVEMSPQHQPPPAPSQHHQQQHQQQQQQHVTFAQEDQEEEVVPNNDDVEQRDDNNEQQQQQHIKYKTEVNRTVDSLRAEIAHLADTMRKQNFKSTEQLTQKLVVDFNVLMQGLDEVRVMQQSLQSQLDKMHQAKETCAVTEHDLEEILEGFKEEMKQNMTDLENKVKDALQTISDRSHWMYGVVLQDHVSVFESHELTAREKAKLPKDSKVQLTYPMQRTIEGTWVRVRTVAEDGTLSIGWVPIWTFAPDVLQKFGGRQPPAQEQKIIYIGHFSLT